MFLSAYGRRHMMEIQELVKEFDDRICLSDQNLSERFGIDNGAAILSQYFQKKDNLYFLPLQINTPASFVTCKVFPCNIFCFKKN